MENNEDFDRDHMHNMTGDIMGEWTHCTKLTHCPSICRCPVDAEEAEVL